MNASTSIISAVNKSEEDKNFDMNKSDKINESEIIDEEMIEGNIDETMDIYDNKNEELKIIETIITVNNISIPFKLQELSNDDLKIIKSMNKKTGKNFFTLTKENHQSVIDQFSKKARRQHIENKFIGFTKDQKTGFHGLCVLGFGLPNEEDDERVYYEFWSRVWLTSENDEIFNLIKSNKELASLVICGGKDEYTIEY
nr:835_t:CDS:2 [Entrophospora candida]